MNLYSHRSQAATEYLMTYGWAFLIIAIVAAILISLGVFSPSTSSTVTGFTSFTSASASVSKINGLVLTLTNTNPNTIYLTNVSLSSSSGLKIGKVSVLAKLGSYSSSNPLFLLYYNNSQITNLSISPGQSFTIIISNVSAYSSYSTQATITYFENGIPQSSTGTISGTPVSSSLYNLPSSFPLFPVTITNTQNVATPSPFQQMINVSASSIVWPFINNNPFGQNIEFIYPNGTVIPSWLESYSPTNAIWWIKIGSIPANSKLTIYMRVVNPSTNLFNGVTVGEAPQLSSTYAEYDNGANVFLNYFPGYSLTGWTTSGTAGVTNRAPSGNPIFGSYAFYANGSTGDYLYTIASSQSNNMIIEYYAYTPLLQDLYFLVNSTGFGQMARDGNGSAYGYKWYGIIHTYSWTNWNGYGVADPSFWSNEWVTIGVVVNNGVATMYLTPRIVPYGSEIGSNPTNSYNNVTDAGNYLGLVGDDAAGDSVIGNPMTTQYWNGIIIRAYPPNGVMPTVSIV